MANMTNMTNMTTNDDATDDDTVTIVAIVATCVILCIIIGILLWYCCRKVHLRYDGSPYHVRLGASLDLKPTVAGGNGCFQGKLVFSSIDLLEGLSIDKDTGIITGLAKEGEFTVVVQNACREARAKVSIIEEPGPDVPQLHLNYAGSPYVSKDGSPVTATPTVTGAKGKLVFSSSDLLEGLDIDPVTGSITGIPAKDGKFTVVVKDEGPRTATATVEVSFKAKMICHFSSAPDDFASLAKCMSIIRDPPSDWLISDLFKYGWVVSDSFSDWRWHWKEQLETSDALVIINSGSYQKSLCEDEVDAARSAILLEEAECILERMQGNQAFRVCVLEPNDLPDDLSQGNDPLRGFLAGRETEDAKKKAQADLQALIEKAKKERDRKASELAQV